MCLWHSEHYQAGALSLKVLEECLGSEHTAWSERPGQKRRWGWEVWHSVKGTYGCAPSPPHPFSPAFPIPSPTSDSTYWFCFGKTQVHIACCCGEKSIKTFPGQGPMAQTKETLSHPGIWILNRVMQRGKTADPQYRCSHSLRKVFSSPSVGIALWSWRIFTFSLILWATQIPIWLLFQSTRHCFDCLQKTVNSSREVRLLERWGVTHARPCGPQTIDILLSLHNNPMKQGLLPPFCRQENWGSEKKLINQCHSKWMTESWNLGLSRVL